MKPIRNKKKYVLWVVGMATLALLSLPVIYSKMYRKSVVNEIDTEYKEGRMKLITIIDESINIVGDQIEFPDGSRYSFSYLLNKSDEDLGGNNPDLVIWHNSDDNLFYGYAKYQNGTLILYAKNKEKALLLKDKLNKYLYDEGKGILEIKKVGFD